MSRHLGKEGGQEMKGVAVGLRAVFISKCKPSVPLTSLSLKEWGKRI